MNHKFDLWLLSIRRKRKAQTLTKRYGWSNENGIQSGELRRWRCWVKLKNALLLSATGEWDEKRGFYSVKVGQRNRKCGVFWYKYSYPTKAKDAEAKLAAKSPTFVDLRPDYYVQAMEWALRTIGLDVNGGPAHKQAEFAWGSRKIVNLPKR